MGKLELTKSPKQAIRSINPRLISYNIEMTEVTGGTFWKAYTEAQIDGTEICGALDLSKGMEVMHQWYDPIDAKNPRLLKLAKALGSCWIRVSGTWATKTYYDFADEYPTGTAPEGYQNVLKKHQWISLLEFVKEVNGKLKISVANCDGLHRHDEPWNPSQAKLIFDLSREYGVPIEAVEFVNEPNMLEHTGFPVGYTAADYRRDVDIFYKWIRENYPECTIVGPSNCDPGALVAATGKKGAGIADVLPCCSCEDLVDECTEKLDVFSYHYYNGVSERMAPMMPGAYTPPEEALGNVYLDMAGQIARAYTSYRDKYVPNGEMWVTESGDSGGGGHTWGSTYMDVPRTLNELADFSTVTKGVIFHNTLASSDYGWLKHGTFEPRPNYFAILLWKQLMGDIVYDVSELRKDGSYVYCHSRKDGQEGYVYLIINNSWEDTLSITLKDDAELYALTGCDKIRSRTMCLNGKELLLGANDDIPKMEGELVHAGQVKLAPGCCAFLVV